jgi:3-hydroxyisobutyrate dehydrogenase/2-hydroxy-3-oxopropionate reductase
MAKNAKETVGLIGAGRMGLPMLKHLVKHGYQVTACDISKDNAARAKEAGAELAADPMAVGEAASFVILGVGYDDEVREVTLGERGVLKTLAPGSIIAVSSTVAPDFVRSVDEQARAKGSDVLDAPICRGRWFADEGKLLALLGGREEVVERGRRVYSTFASDVAWLGDVGHGQVAKAINNYLLWITSLGLIEAGRLAASTGIDLPKLREALMMSSGKSQALEDWDQTTFTWALKDMQIVSGISDRAGLALPLVGIVKELVKEGRRVKASDPPPWTRKTEKGK